MPFSEVGHGDTLRRKRRERTNLLYIIEAAVEYFISILVAGAYLATVTKALGVSDALTGILSAFVSLGQSFQLVALFFARQKRIKWTVTLMQLINQLCFAAVFFIPFFQGNVVAKIVVFVVLFLLGHALHNVAYPAKTNWFMSQVDDHNRGRFTATKEIVSLIGGMIFSLVMSFFMDELKASGNTQGAFLLCGIGIVALAVLHACTLIFSHEEKAEEREKITTVSNMLGGMLKDKNLRKVIFLPVLWHIAHYVATPFYGSYLIGELGWQLTFVSLLSALSAITRSSVSHPIGRYADKTSFTTMLNLCFTIAAAAFFVNIFTTPQTSPVTYTLYTILYAISMAGINSGEINLIYDFVEPERRVGALALKNFLAGTAGFLTTLLISPLVEFIQASGNQLFGIPVYAQQVMSVIACVLTVVTIVYLNLVLRKLPREKKEK
ncbi:MAG: MFS transporter [Clostridia bacterium]|nr:MFS transporter [Clostridia bacterium]